MVLSDLQVTNGSKTANNNVAANDAHSKSTASNSPAVTNRSQQQTVVVGDMIWTVSEPPSSVVAALESVWEFVVSFSSSRLTFVGELFILTPFLFDMELETALTLLTVLLAFLVALLGLSFAARQEREVYRRLTEVQTSDSVGT